MKTWTFLPLPLLCLVGCTSPKPPPIAIRPMPASAIGPETAATVRYPEALKAYHVGRYVEPQSQFVMHEQHTVYRVESLANWNLHPSRSDAVRVASATSLKNAAFAPLPTNDDIIAELNRQRQVTHVVTVEASRLTSSLQQLGQAISETRAIAQQNIELRQQISNALKRIELIETELKKQRAARVQGLDTTEAPPPPPQNE